MATLNLRVLIKAVADLGPVRAMSRGLGGLTRPAKAFGLTLKSVGKDLLMLGTAGLAGILALSAGLWTLVRRTADAGDAALLAAQKTGVQIEAYQRLAYAAKLSNVEAEGLDTGLKFLNQSIDAAGQGSKQDVKAFRDLGISLRGVNGDVRSTEDLLISIADKFEKMPDGPRKTAIAMALFGRSGVDMIPMLNEGGAAIRRWGKEAQEAGLVLSEQAARDADEFNDSLDRLKMGGMGLGNALLSGLLPQLTQLIERARTFIAANKPEIIRQMTKVIGELTAAAPDLIAGLLAFVKLLAALAKVVLPVVQALGGFGAVLDMVAGIMIGRLAIAIWTAVKAVWGLNAAMYANPIGLIIAGIAALVFAGWLLYRNWDKVVAWIKKAWSGMVKFFVDLGVKMKAAFKLAIDALWLMLPPWIRMIFRGAKFLLKVVGSGLNGGGPGAGASGPAAAGAAGNAGRPPNAQVAVGVTVHHDRPPTVRATTSDPRTAPLRIQSNRGGYWR